MNDVIKKIQEHLSLLDMAVSSSEKIFFHAKNENINEVASETENRDRLVHIISEIQLSIEDRFNTIDESLISKQDIELLKYWLEDLNIWSVKMLTFDQETLEFLSQQKENTTKEIAHIFKTKELFKGYNHSSKKD